MRKRSIGILLLLAIVGFYAFGTGFDFFWRFFYVLILLMGLGFAWAWVNLRGIEVQLTRSASRGQVGGYLEGAIRLSNRIRIPKSWLEVVEVTDLPDPSQGRGVALVKDQVRAWRTEIYLSRRGVYQTGQVEVTSQDSFGLFRLSRKFLSPQSYTVLPATEPLPDLDTSLAGLPSDGRATRHWDHITTDVASIRHYVDGDSLRRIHWPYTARMNSLMVKEFDMGLSAETWVILDMESKVHVGVADDRVENTEELAVTVAASIIGRLVELAIPVGLAASGGQSVVLRPNSSPDHLGRLMEALAAVRASGTASLERFVYDLRPSFSRFNTLTVVTPNTQADWVPTLASMRRRGINVSAVLIDPEGYGKAPSVDTIIESLSANETPGYVVKRGQSLNEALRSSVTGRIAAGTAVAATTEVEAVR